jgi:hypothetical protein
MYICVCIKCGMSIEIISRRLTILNYSSNSEESPSIRDFELTASDPRVKGDGVPGWKLYEFRAILDIFCTGG